MIKKLILLPAIALSLMISGASFADMKKYKNCHYKDKTAMMKYWEKNLNLTEEQKKQIKNIKKNSYYQKKAIIDKMMGLENEVHTLVTSGKMDESKLNDWINKKKELLGEKLKIKLETKHKIYNLLNDKQKEKFTAMMKKWKQKNMERMKKMMNYQNDNIDEDDS